MYEDAAIQLCSWEDFLKSAWIRARGCTSEASEAQASFGVATTKRNKHAQCFNNAAFVGSRRVDENFYERTLSGIGTKKITKVSFCTEQNGLTQRMGLCKKEVPSLSQKVCINSTLSELTLCFHRGRDIA